MTTRRKVLASAGVCILAAPAFIGIASAQVELKVISASPKNVKLHWRNKLGRNFETLSSLHDHLLLELATPLALMNAGIFEVGSDGNYQPQGLHVENGEMLRPVNTKSARNANFYMKPNGIFYIDTYGAHIVRTEDYAPTEQVRVAVQSGPLLFDKCGVHPSFLEGSNSRKRRNAVALRDESEVVFALSDYPINFFDFAQTLRLTHGCSAALYMDGSISDLWLSSGQRAPNDWQSFSAMLSVSE